MRTAILGFLALTIAACNQAKPSSKSTDSLKSISLDPNAMQDRVRGEAQAFLKALTGGDFKAALDLTTVSFRKDVSGALTFDEERKLGYSNSDAEKYLRSAAGGATQSLITSLTVSAKHDHASVRGELSGKEKRVFSMRLAHEEGSWKVTRFAVVKLTSSGTPVGTKEPALIWARETALDFIESLVGGGDEQLLTMPLMTEAFKQRMPAPSVADAGSKYAKKDVRQWLNATRGGAIGYNIDAERLDGANAVFDAHLVGPGKSTPIRFTLITDGSGWMIESLEIKT